MPRKCCVTARPGSWTTKVPEKPEVGHICLKLSNISGVFLLLLMTTRAANNWESVYTPNDKFRKVGNIGAKLAMAGAGLGPRIGRDPPPSPSRCG